MEILLDVKEKEKHDIICENVTGIEGKEERKIYRKSNNE